MTIYVSRSWPADDLSHPFPGKHPHARGAGNYYHYPDEMWAAAQEQFRSLQVVSSPIAPGMEVKCEWRRGYPEGYHLMEGAFCALDDKPEEIVPDFRLGRNKSRRVICVGQPTHFGVAA